MELEALITLVTVALALSMATERAVALFKTHPWLGNDKGETAGVRWFVIQAIAFSFGALFSFAITGGTLDGVLVLKDNGPSIPWWILGLLASGGSTFWKDLLGILNNLKQTQQATRRDREIAAFARQSGTRQRAFGARLIDEGQPSLPTGR